MIRKLRMTVAAMLGMSLLAAGALTAADEKAPAKPDAKGPAAVAVIKGTEAHKDVKGRLMLRDVEGGVQVSGQISGLTPGKHGFHVHEKGDLSDPKLVSAGGHFNPGGAKHGGPHGEERHAGDWGNIVADDKGVAKVEGVFKGVSLSGEKNGIVGRSIIVHAGEDDLKTDPAGNAGDRIAGAVIQLQKKAPAKEGAGEGAAKKEPAKKEVE